MEKVVTIDGKEYKLKATGSTPRVYRSLFKSDVFADIRRAVTPTGDLVGIDVFENLAYCMAIQGGSISTGTSIEDWLDSFESPTAIIEVATDLMEMWSDETDTMSVGKKG
jgi:hypothetical protein